MEKIANKQINLTPFFLLATVMLGLLSVSTNAQGCLHDHDVCNPNAVPPEPQCCTEEGLVCEKHQGELEYTCHAVCEEHAGHECDLEHPCCDGLTCVSNLCECVLKPGDSCVPGVSNCCDLECVQVASQVYQCTQL